MEPTTGFIEVYTEIYIKRAKVPVPPPVALEEGENQPLGEDGENEEKKVSEIEEEINGGDDEEEVKDGQTNEPVVSIPA